MDSAAVTLRDANPARDEGAAFARYLAAVSPLYRIVLGRRAQDLLAKAFAKPGHDLSYERAIVAERDGAVVGMISGHPADRPLRAADGLGRRMQSLARLMACQRWFLGRFGDGDYVIPALAVDESNRRQGIGSALIDAMEEQARAAGANRLVLNVKAGNLAARSLYARCGMVVERAWPRIPLIPALVLRMAKTI